ncbi:MAG: glutamate--tRNA ligase [Deltaproteobacteria bacterium]|nr:glutamate--tRNA ligase [Deltaproteobacteria bacterium]
MPRFRFAPSPTGHLHIGGTRTALYNFLMAKKTGGQFILRIEDTDQERSTQEYVESILQGMQWLGLSWNEGPYFQTARAKIYQEHIEKLLHQGQAYRCYCSVEQLETMRKTALKAGLKPKYNGTCRELNQQDTNQPHCIRFKSKQWGVTKVVDLIKGGVDFDNAELDDFIIARTDGSPTYNFVVVVDDVDMKITHVIRGDDHLNNTPRQVLLYEALNYPIPQFAHVPMILGADKKRLSKRHGATSVTAYRDMGYLPEALVNYLVRLGWACGDEEIFNLEELIQKFDIQDVGKSAGVFNPEKLLWLNGHYIRQATPQHLLEHAKPFFAQSSILLNEDAFTLKAIASCQEKVKTLLELVTLSQFYFTEDYPFVVEAKEKFLKPEHKALLTELKTFLETLDPFSKENLETQLKAFAEKKSIKFNALAQPLRVALTGTTVSPSLFDLLAILGKEKTLTRLHRVLNLPLA